jgi:formate hydrogenlyase subunit 3/multisubunit Na+/H+ antiporter MnhD subunit
VAAFSDKGDAIHAWISILFSQLFMNLSIGFLNHQFEITFMIIYLSGTVISAITGYLCLLKIKQVDRDIRLDRFHGYTYEYPVTGFVFLMAGLGVLGLPFTPTFIGIDLLFSHIHRSEEFVIILTSLSFLVLEISILRIYARVFLGQHKKHTHAMAYRSS